MGNLILIEIELLWKGIHQVVNCKRAQNFNKSKNAWGKEYIQCYTAGVLKMAFSTPSQN